MPKIWTKPFVGATALGVAGAFYLSLDGIAHAVNPLSPHEDHDTFQLVQASTTTSTVIITLQNTVTGDPIEVTRPDDDKLGEGEADATWRGWLGSIGNE